MMNRQQAAIAIAKISETSQRLKYWMDLKPESYVTALDSQLSHFGEWAQDLADYLLTDPNEKVYQMLWIMGPPKHLQAYMNLYGEAMPTVVRHSLLVYIPIIEKLRNEGRSVHALSKGKYKYLADGLDNPRAVELLKRAQDANLLDDKYMPKVGVTRAQLKVLAYSVAQMMGYDKQYRMKWKAFNEQWPSSTDHLANIKLPNIERADMKLITDLYPEVDYTDLVVNPNDFYFITKMAWPRINSLYWALKANGYIDANTTLHNFHNIFKPEDKEGRQPVNWIKDERQLSLFVSLVLREGNELGLWVKAANCFLVKGRRPNRATLAMFLTKIKKNASANRLHDNDTKLLNVIGCYIDKNSYFCIDKND